MSTLESQVKRVKERFWEKLTASILTAFGVIVAIAWADAMKSLFEHYFSPENTVPAKCAYAFFVTILLVLFSLRFAKEEEQKKELNDVTQQKK